MGNKAGKGSEFEKRFWSKTKIGEIDQCWLWQGTVLDTGYGQFWNGKRKIGAHQFSLELKIKRKLKKGEWALHKCDIPGCVNPNHLFPGSRQTNMDDCIQKGRNARGRRHPSSKLNDIDVIHIRESYKKGKTLKQVASIYGVDFTNVLSIVKGLTWKHVGGPRSLNDMRKERNGGSLPPSVPITKNCEHCGKEYFSMLFDHRRYCSTKCAGAGSWKGRKINV